MAEEELTRCVKARSAGDEAPCVDHDSGKADLVSDDAPVAVPSFASDDVLVAVPSSLSTLKSPATRKRRQVVGQYV